MKRFIEGDGRSQAILFPEYLDDWIAEDNPVRVYRRFDLRVRWKARSGTADAATIF